LKRGIVKSAWRTLEVLELFEEERRPLRLHEIYEALGYPQSSATNLLKSMVMMGYLNYSHTTWTYLPTARVASLGKWLFQFMYGQRDYRGLIDRIQRETDETAVLAMQNDLFIQYVTVCEPEHDEKIPPPEGGLRVMTRSSAGLALMSEMSDRQVEKLIRQIHYYELSGEDALNLKDIMREVDWVRRTGYCLLKDSIPGASGIAFPLRDEHHGIHMAIGVGGTTDRISRKEVDIIEIVQNAISEFEAEASEFDEQALTNKLREMRKRVHQTNEHYHSLY
jgi:DNA-binding IclR family transcriptional regulator